MSYSREPLNPLNPLLNTSFRITVLISGRGSNLLSLIQHAKNYRIVEVISDNSDAPGLRHAHQAGIDVIGFSRRSYPSLIAHKQAIYDKLEQTSHDLIVLAGFMQILEKEFVERHAGRIVNIHPSLLPAFRGLDSHKRALETFRRSGGKKACHGCTVHFVNTEVDTGPIIAQTVCPIESSDCEETLAARVLKHEHRIYPWVVNKIASRNICYQNGTVVLDKSTALEAERLGFNVIGFN